MNISFLKTSSLCLLLIVFSSGCGNKNKKNIREKKGETTMVNNKKNIKIILGSTREQSMSKKIGLALKNLVDKKGTINAEIIDLGDYSLPFLYEQTAPARRTEITDTAIQRWSDTIIHTDGFILVVPEYNSGYPGVLKNALDLLYKEWNNKPVMLVGHSGGPSGGKNALKQLKEVVLALQMTPIDQELLIPTSWKALSADGLLAEPEQEVVFDKALDELITILK